MKYNHLIKKENADLFKLCLSLYVFVSLTVSDHEDEVHSSDKIQMIFSIFDFKQMISVSSKTTCKIYI